MESGTASDQQPSRALIACGGFGTRLLPATKAVPKALLPVVDRPLLQHVIEEAAQAGLHEIGILHRPDQASIPAQVHGSRPLVEQLKRLGRTAQLEALERFESLARIRCFPGSDELTGLGGQLLEVEEFLAGEPFALLFVDELCDPLSNVLEGLKRAHVGSGRTVVAARLGPGAPPLCLVESIPALEPAGSPHGSPGSRSPRLLGRMIGTPDLLMALQAIRESTPGPVDVMDGLRLLAGHQLLLAYRYDGRWWDCGSRAGYLSANLALALEDPDLGPGLRASMAQG